MTSETALKSAEPVRSKLTLSNSSPLIVTSRPEFRPSWPAQPQVTTLAINRLPRHEIGASERVLTEISHEAGLVLYTALDDPGLERR